MKKNVLALLISVSLLLSSYGLTRIDHVNAQAPVPTNVPIGTVMAFTGELTPANIQMLRQAGWLLCDGASLRRLTPSGQPTEYAALYAVIRETFGDGRDEPPSPGGVSPKTGDFNLPDMRGRFLRGVDSGMGRDPDANARLPMRQGGKAGDQVGSIQDSAFAAHKHEVSGTTNGRPFSSTARNASEWPSGFAGGDAFADGGQSGVSRNAMGVTVSMENSGGSTETRPKNINVNWIIKFR